MGRLGCIALALVSVANPEVADRVAVALDHQAITESAVEEEVRVTAYLNKEQPDFSPASRRAAAGRLIEQILVEREIEISQYPQPSPEDVDRMMDGLRSSGVPPLKSYGLTESILRQHLSKQLSFLLFIDLRFRPGIAVTPEEVQQYYQEHYVTAPQDQGPPPALDDVWNSIEEVLTDQKLDVALDEWLDQTRQRSRIRYIEEAFQ
jgi:peptidyl-prolyl cis-trans isomerase SurA